MMRSTLLLATVLLFACGKKKLPTVVEPAPAWSTQNGRERAKLELATAMLEGGAAEQALSLLGQMRAEGTDGPDIDVLQARALGQIGLLDDAADMLERVVARHSRNADAWNQLGIVRMDRKELELSVQAFENAARLAEDRADIENNLGFALMAAGRPADAVAPLRRALKLDASKPLTKNNLGFALVAAGKEQEAWRVFRAAGAEADAHYNLAYGLELRGDGAAALGHYRSALKANPNFRSAEEAIHRLAPPAPEKSP
jgi:Tfp pilus assembly protein PilF